MPHLCIFIFISPSWSRYHKQNDPDGTRIGLKEAVVQGVQSHLALLQDPSSNCAPSEYTSLQVICKDAEVFIEHPLFEECNLACGEALKKVNSNRLAAAVQESLVKLTKDGQMDLEEVKTLTGILQSRTDKMDKSEKMGDDLLKQVCGLDAPDLGHYLGFKAWLPEWQRLVLLLKPILLKAEYDKLSHHTEFWQSMWALAAASDKYDHATKTSNVVDPEGNRDDEGAATSNADERLQCLQDLNRSCKLATAAQKACMKCYGKAEPTAMDDQVTKIITGLQEVANKEGLAMVKEGRELNKNLVTDLQKIQGGSKHGPEVWWTGCPAEEMGWDAFCVYFKENSCPEENLKSLLSKCEEVFKKDCDTVSAFGKMAAWKDMKDAIGSAKSSYSSLKLMNCYLDDHKTKTDRYTLTKDEIAFHKAAGKTAIQLGWPELLMKAMKGAMKMTGPPT